MHWLSKMHQIGDWIDESFCRMILHSLDCVCQIFFLFVFLKWMHRSSLSYYEISLPHYLKTQTFLNVADGAINLFDLLFTFLLGNFFLKWWCICSTSLVINYPEKKVMIIWCNSKMEVAHFGKMYIVQHCWWRWTNSTY